MEQLNAYIQVEFKKNEYGQNEGICHFYPAKEGGEELDFKSAVEYLNNSGFDVSNGRELQDLLKSTAPAQIVLGESMGLDFSESMSVSISLDKMKAIVKFYPGSFGGPKMDAKDILTTLQKKGVNFGIDQDKIIQFLDDRVYFTDYVLAEGIPARHGIDDKIEYFFNTNPSLKPKRNEDGSVDYHSLNTISKVKEGDLLARLHKGDRGANGKDVCGKDIPCRVTKILRLTAGKNMHLSEDETELYSDVVGHVSLSADNKVVVSDVYEVSGDVDNSVGNIEYDGNVHVRGSVRGGFSIIAKGDVIVEGVVEDALIQSEGQIIVRCGIHGMKKGILDARGNVITKFIENASVFSGGYVESGMITYSDVSASDDIIIKETKGFIIGGVIRAGGKVDATTIGSSMGASTRIEVGMAPEKKERYSQLQKEIQSVSQNISKLKPIMNTYNQYIQQGKKLDQKNAIYLQKIADELKNSTDTLAADQEEFTKLHQELLTSKHAKVIVRRDIYPGVSMTISDITYNVKDKRSSCQFEKKNGEVVVTLV